MLMHNTIPHICHSGEKTPVTMCVLKCVHQGWLLVHLFSTVCFKMCPQMTCRGRRKLPASEDTQLYRLHLFGSVTLSVVFFPQDFYFK